MSAAGFARPWSLMSGKSSHQAGLQAHAIELATLGDEVGGGIHLCDRPSVHHNHPGEVEDREK